MNDYEKTNESVIVNGDNNIFENIHVIKTALIVILIFVLGLYFVLIKWFEVSYHLSSVLCILAIFFCVYNIIKLYEYYIMHNLLNYKEYTRFIQKIMRMKENMGVTPYWKSEVLCLAYCMINTRFDEFENLKDSKIKEIIKRFVAEEEIICQEYENAKKIIDSFEKNTQDIRDDYLDLIAQHKFEEALKILKNKKNRYRATLVIHSFWKGFCLYQLDNKEEAIQDFSYCIKYGGDSKYRMYSFEILKNMYGTPEEDCNSKTLTDKEIQIDRFYKDYRIWINFLMILLILFIQIFM